jgi:glycosyltransferase involved in cell wall biosynthesis
MIQIKNSNIPLISIGLPVYHAKKFIRKRLKNILSQSFQDFKLIISVDPSDDLTQQICLEFSKKYKRIKIFEQTKK